MSIPVKGEVWRNRKTGTPYAVICIGTDTTNSRDGDRVVIYEPELLKQNALHAENRLEARTTELPYVRELSEFVHKFDRIDGVHSERALGRAGREHDHAKRPTT